MADVDRNRQSVQTLLPRRPLVVKPIFAYPLPERQTMTSWRSWGGVQTRPDVDDETARIGRELDGLSLKADFPLQILPLAVIRHVSELAPHQRHLSDCDAILFYSDGDGGGNLMATVNHVDGLGKDVIFFVRHQSGPLYYWYEGAMARFLHQHTDQLAAKSVGYEDVVVDRMDEVLWRMRALCGLRNTRGSRVLAVGGLPGGEHAQARWKFDVQPVPDDELVKLIRAAQSDRAAVDHARRQASDYLQLPQTTLEADRKSVENAFLLEQVLRRLMKQADCRTVAIGGCTQTILPVAQATPCLAVSGLNDSGCLAFCDAGLAEIAAGMLLGNITGRPVFLSKPTYPHDGILTLAHCTAPRTMDGRSPAPVRILTHYESDSAAAPKVQMLAGQVITNVVPDFKSERWLGLPGKIAECPELPACRSQIEVRFEGDAGKLAQRIPGFHWFTCYGNWLRETGYALKRVPVAWECFG